MQVRSEENAARAVIAGDLIEHAGWQEIVLPLVLGLATGSFKALAYGSEEQAGDQRGAIKALRQLVHEVYTSADEPIPERLKPFFE